MDPSDVFDFTSYELPEEDAGSKVATPDLVQASSSVGPSPGSASETEAHPPASSHTADTAKIADPKSEPNNRSKPDALRLAINLRARVHLVREWNLLEVVRAQQPDLV
ncbi:hypothetical protein ONZ51_g4274 [Trametes cubensis]|uniref:Uncharacterized protein n=1 Tax=Trametes cubensis TaxID=1111947 RepID=A0AAD7XEU8_9APHY|nr:hypothetical protein ONZ51_g4274 [Trametes cubensis]